MAQSKVVKQVLKATPRRRDSLDRSRGPFEKSPSMSPHDEDRPPLLNSFHGMDISKKRAISYFPVFRQPSLPLNTPFVAHLVPLPTLHLELDVIAPARHPPLTPEVV